MEKPPKMNDNKLIKQRGKNRIIQFTAKNVFISIVPCLFLLLFQLISIAHSHLNPPVHKYPTHAIFLHRGNICCTQEMPPMNQLTLSVSEKAPRPLVSSFFIANLHLLSVFSTFHVPNYKYKSKSSTLKTPFEADCRIYSNAWLNHMRKTDEEVGVCPG